MRADRLDHSGGTPFSIARREKEPTDFLPYARHADAGTIVSDGGALIAVVQLEGASFETLDQSDLNGLHEKINSTLRNLLSGRASTIGLVDELRAELGDDPKDWLPAFHEKRRGLR